MKFLHIIPDDKFWRPVIGLFDKVEAESEFVSLVGDDCNNLKYIDTERIKLIRKRDVGLLWNDSTIDVYMFHSLPFSYYDYVLSVPQDKKIIVSFWGFDIYYSQMGCPPILQVDLYKKKTAELMQSLLPDHDWLSRAKRLVKRNMLYRKKYKEFERLQCSEIQKRIDKQKKVLGRIDYAATVLPIEYELLSNSKLISAKRFPFHYVSRSIQSVPVSIDKKEASLVLVGNSGDPSNNHIDILMLLKERGIENKLYLPLAYGEADYSDKIKQYVMANGFDYEIQEMLLKPSEYKDKLLKCRAAIFGHIRQQSMGNIIVCMLQGTKVFLFKDSLTYRFFKRLGSIVFSIEDDLSLEEIQKPLNDTENEINTKNLDWLTVESILPELNRTIKEMMPQ